MWKIKKFYVILSICLFGVLLSSYSTSYASSFSVQNVKDTVDYLKNLGYLEDFPTYRINDVANYINNNSFTTYGILQVTNFNVGGSIILACRNGPIIYRSDCCIWDLYGNNQRTNQNWAQVNTEDVLLAYSPNGELPIVNITAGQLYSSFPTWYFTPNGDAIVSFNNYDNVYALLRNYSVNQWYIGKTHNFNQLDSFTFSLFDLTDNFNTGNVYGNKENNKISGNGTLYFNNGDLAVNSRYIVYRHLYNLEIHMYINNAEIVKNYYYVFLPRNATIVNGQITSPGSGDFTIQDSTNAVIDDMSNSANLSGDLAALTSGDIYNKLGFKTYNTNWATFIWNMLLDLKDKLLLDNGPVTFTFPYMKTYITVSSADFTVPNGLLKGFVSTFLTFGLFVLIYQRITALYHRLEEGNVSEVVTWSDVDDETFLM